jgi:hypothetical protein
MNSMKQVVQKFAVSEIAIEIQQIKYQDSILFSSHLLFSYAILLLLSRNSLLKITDMR